MRIEPGGTVTLFTGKVELGQGLKTAIARIGAEELDVALARVRVHTADTAHGLNELFTVGSSRWRRAAPRCVRPRPRRARTCSSWPPPSSARPRRLLEVDDGTVSAPGLERTTTYWELFGGRRFEQ